MELFARPCLSEAVGFSILVFVSLWWSRLMATPNTSKSSPSDASPDTDESRDIVRRMDGSNKNCVVFFGSQTGTAESYAVRLAKEGKSRFGLKTMVANLEDYDLQNLASLPSDKIAMFVISTYGEGEPPDSTVAFYNLMVAEDSPFASDGSLANLTYAAFGLGNKTYEHYNAVIRKVTKALNASGADHLGPVGEADDGAGTTEEDFLAWKEIMWPICAKHMGAVEHSPVYTPSFRVTECDDLTAEAPGVYLGEPHQNHLVTAPSDILGPFDAHNPHLSLVAGSKQLLSPSVTTRNCVHVDLNIAGSGLTYEAGDHAAIWPSNPSEEVEKLLRILGLESKAQTVVKIESLDTLGNMSLPTPTTYDAVMRYYLEIGSPVSWQTISDIVAFAPNDEAKDKLAKLVANKNLFYAETHFSTLSRVLGRYGGPGVAWTQIPFAFLIESLPKLQPRFYSISSSPLMHPGQLSLTVAVKSERVAGRPSSDPFCGIASNYLLAVSKKQNDGSESWSTCPKYDVGGPRGKFLQGGGIHIPLHIRHSNFKLPKDMTAPIIMIGPGTGVAPFRGFIQERVKQVSEGATIGPLLLFFGCRKGSEDFIYENEWQEYMQMLGPSFKMFTAFSREETEKVYVQHLLKKNGAEVSRLLQSGAYVYVCGDAKYMAKEVAQALVDIIMKGCSVSREESEEVVKNMRTSSHYQEDVWA